MYYKSILYKHSKKSGRNLESTFMKPALVAGFRFKCNTDGLYIGMERKIKA